MSVSYWMCEGIGIRTNDLYPFLNTEKCIKVIKEQLPDDDNGDGEHYFYYTRSYPWERRNNEPQSIEEVYERIIAAVIRICDISPDDIRVLVDEDIYDYGCG